MADDGMMGGMGAMREHEKKGGHAMHEGKKKKRAPRKKGGSAKVGEPTGEGMDPHNDAKANMYNAEGTPAAKAAHDETPEFKAGGEAHGHKGKHRGDRKARGHHASGGRTEHSPYSSGRKLGTHSDSSASRGMEGMSVPSEPD